MLTVVVGSNSRSRSNSIIFLLYWNCQLELKERPLLPASMPLRFLVADGAQLITLTLAFLPAVGKKGLYHVGILFLYCVSFWLAIYFRWSRFMCLLSTCSLVVLP